MSSTSALRCRVPCPAQECQVVRGHAKGERRGNAVGLVPAFLFSSARTRTRDGAARWCCALHSPHGHHPGVRVVWAVVSTAVKSVTVTHSRTEFPRRTGCDHCQSSPPRLMHSTPFSIVGSDCLWQYMLHASTHTPQCSAGTRPAGQPRHAASAPPPPPCPPPCAASPPAPIAGTLHPARWPPAPSQCPGTRDAQAVERRPHFSHMHAQDMCEGQDPDTALKE